MAGWFTPSIQATDLTPVTLDEKSEHSGLVVEKSVEQNPAEKHEGLSALAEVFSRDLDWLRGSGKAKFKVTGLRMTGNNRWHATAKVTFSGTSRSHPVEQHATWSMDWTRTDREPPKIAKLAVQSFEQVTQRAATGPLFAECTASLLSENACYSNQILRGAQDHTRRFPLRLSLEMACLRGFGVGDVNGDGLEDIYLCEEPGLPNRLFLQQADGTLNDVSAEWGVDWIEDSRSALLVDLDNDGDQDLVIGIYRDLVILSNEKNRRFQLRKVLPCSESVTHLCAADYNLDGKLDLYVGCYNPKELFQNRIGQMVASAGVHLLYDSNTGGANHLFRSAINDESWAFVDVTQASGLDQNNRRFAFAAAWEDIDNDGDQDLYVANDFGRNNLFRNDLDPDGNRTFVDVAADANGEDQAPGMSVSLADYNLDGLMDIYVGNMWSAAGLRVTTQEQFKPDIASDVRNSYQRFARGNTM